MKNHQKEEDSNKLIWKQKKSTLHKLCEVDFFYDIV